MGVKQEVKARLESASTESEIMDLLKRSLKKTPQIHGFDNLEFGKGKIMFEYGGKSYLLVLKGG